MHAFALSVMLMAAVGQCDECAGQGGVHAQHPLLWGSQLATGPMPQTCYSPKYGCYQSNNRHMNRYPAFHGYYYRRPYNYRNLFDYPWHAELHEPTSLFSYHVPAEELLDLPPESIDPGASEVVPPTPPAPVAPQARVSQRRSPSKPTHR